MERNFLIDIIEKWGAEVQINKIQEEALELALALNHMNCPTKIASQVEANIYEELADMKIMMAQAEIIFDKSRIDALVKIKLERLRSKYFQNSGT